MANGPLSLMIGTDLYTGFALSGLVELPAVGITYIAIESIGNIAKMKCG